MTFLFCFCNHNCALPVLIEAYFLLILFGIYDDLTKDHVPGLQKYDICMTEQVSGSRRVKIVGRHIATAPNGNKRRVINILFMSPSNYMDVSNLDIEQVIA